MLGNTPFPPWGRWENQREVGQYRPMSTNVVYMPLSAINARERLDAKSLLVRVNGATREENVVADFIKNT